MSTTRIERDALGSMEIPANAYWGIHTRRAMENFALSGFPVSAALIRAIADVKKAACLANRELGYLTPATSDAIARACDEIASGTLADQFPLDALQGGAGTSTNMNVNEVIANRAIELLGGAKGDYETVHPLLDVNKHQSTNDVYPTALKVAAIREFRALSRAIEALQGALQRKEKEFAGVVKMGRTETREAVPITVGSEFGAFAECVARDRWRTFKCEERLRVVNLGGTAVGTGLTAPRNYIFLVGEKLRELTGLPVARAENLMDATANADPFVEVSGILKAHAANLIKICGDLRWMSGLGEIKLEKRQVGSSVMPGKINPVMLEAGIQVGMKVFANDTMVADAVSRGTFQISEFLPLVAHALLESLFILAAFDDKLAAHVDRIEVDAEACRARLEASFPLITAFLPAIGYEKAERLVKKFCETKVSNVRAFMEQELGREMVEKVLSPEKLMALGHSHGTDA